MQGVIMKRFLLPLSLFFIFSISSPLASFAAGDRTVTILYTGAVRGNIEPCAV
jgi:hypothetical protein